MKYLMSCIILITATAGISAQCLDGNCYNGNGTYLYKSGAQYTGHFRDGKINGKGTLRHGEYSFASGDQYQGQFQKGQFHGEGTMFYASGSKYIGLWADNKKNGKGKIFNLDGKTQEGEWHNDEMIRTERNPAKKESTINSNKTRKVETTPSSKNKFKDCNKLYCNAEKGQYTYRDGTRYIGEFYSGKPRGKGTVFYANGDKYVGAWDTNRPHGDGVIYFKNGRVLHASWKDGNVVKQKDDLHNLPEELVEVDNNNEVKIWSVIVGVSRYHHMPTLKYTDDDAYHLYAFLKSPEGGAVPDEQIAVLIDEDANRSQILRTMKRKFHKADENDVIVFYFSGHGYNGSFIPSDFDGQKNLLRHEDIIDILHDSKAKHKVVFADACHSGSLDSNQALAMKSGYSGRLNDYYKKFNASNGGLALLLSSKKEEYSLEDHGLRQGVFSHYLMRGLKGEANANSDYTVSISELFNYVHKNVTRYTGNVQTPTITGKYDMEMPVAMIR